MTDEPTHRNRKVEHLHINLEENVQFTELTTGLERYRFIHQALPDLALDQIDTTLSLFGRTLTAPILISSMTGGAPEAERINRNLARAAQQARVAMGVGSQRAAIEDESLARTFLVRDLAPDILLFANLGAVQLNYGYGVDHCRRAVDMIGADALILHLNPIQEAAQSRGNTNWSGLLPKIEAVCRELQVPVVVKEVGFGISRETAGRLASVGVAAIDVAGAGGTSWTAVESRRAPTPQLQALAASFWNWGIPTAESLVRSRRGAPDIPIFASGGLRDGIDIAKAIALGATLGGLASPMLKLANVSSEAAFEGLQMIALQVRVAMFGIGAANLGKLRDTQFLEAVRL